MIGGEKMVYATGSSKIITAVVFIIFIAVCIGIGMAARWYSSKQIKVGGNFLSEFFTGSHGMGPIATGMMMGAAMCSAGTFISGPGYSYQVGLCFELAILCGGITNFVVLGTIGKKIGIVARRTNAVSFVSLLRSRYNNNKPVCLMAALGVVIFFSAYVASQFIGGAHLMESMAGISYELGLLVFAVVVLLYTAFGGARGVSISVVFQGFVMTIAVFVLLFSTISKINTDFGSVQAGFQSLASTNPELLTPYTPEFTLPMMFSCFFMYSLASIGLPHSVTGALNYRDSKSMKGAIIVGFIVVLLWDGIMTFMGPLSHILDGNLPGDFTTQYLALTTLPSAGTGIIVAGATGAIQSTVSAMLLIITSAIVKDIFVTYFKPNASEKTCRKATYVTTFCVLAIVTAFALNPPDFLQNLINFAIGGLSSTFFIPILLGVLWKRANEYGALASMVGGFVYYLFASTSVPVLALGMKPIVMGVLVSAVLMIIVSNVTPKAPKGIIMAWFGRDYYTKES